MNILYQQTSKPKKNLFFKLCVIIYLKFNQVKDYFTRITLKQLKCYEMNCERAKLWYTTKTIFGPSGLISFC